MDGAGPAGKVEELPINDINMSTLCLVIFDCLFATLTLWIVSYSPLISMLWRYIPISRRLDRIENIA
jgi:hypothetical protein